MQFKKAQRAELARSWNEGSWFFRSLGVPTRHIVEAAYGLRAATPQHRTKCQEDVTLAVSLFARKIGAHKSQAAHALLTGSLPHLATALEKAGSISEEYTLRQAWQNAFRETNQGTNHAE